MLKDGKTREDKMKSFRNFSETNIVNIDRQIDAQKKRHDSVSGKTPNDKKHKERVRDSIERLRDRRNKLSGSPKSEPMEAKQAPTGTYDIDDLNAVDYKPGEDKFSKRNAKRRKRADVEHESTEYDEERLDEVLNMAQRRKAALNLRRNKSKIKMGKRRQAHKLADKGRLAKRARSQAKTQLIKKMTKGVSKGDLSPQRRAEIERRLEKMKGRVDKISRKILPSVRKADIQKRRHK